MIIGIQYSLDVLGVGAMEEPEVALIVARRPLRVLCMCALIHGEELPSAHIIPAGRKGALVPTRRDIVRLISYQVFDADEAFKLTRFGRDSSSHAASGDLRKWRLNGR